MSSRTHIVVDTDVLNAQSTALGAASAALDRAAASAGGTLPASAFGMLASSLLPPAANGLADHAAQKARDRDGIEGLRATTSGEASEAAIATMSASLADTIQRAERLTRNAGVIRRLAEVYDTCDLAGARALGA